MSLLQAEAVRFAYGRHRVALTDVSVATTGQAVALLGPNGAGKSTLLSLVTAARQPSSGSLRVLEQALAEPGARRKVQAQLGFVPQAMGLFPGYTLREFVRYVGWLRHVPPVRLEAALGEALTAVDLAEHADVKIRTLSGGMRQRLILAQALVNDPAVVILDEPTVGLDPEQRARFLDLLTRVRQRCQILLATHLVEDVAAVCDEVLVLDAGRCAFTGPTGTLVEHGGQATLSGPAVQAGYEAVLATARGNAAS